MFQFAVGLYSTYLEKERLNESSDSIRLRRLFETRKGIKLVTPITIASHSIAQKYEFTPP